MRNSVLCPIAGDLVYVGPVRNIGDDFSGSVLVLCLPFSQTDKRLVLWTRFESLVESLTYARARVHANERERASVRQRAYERFGGSKSIGLTRSSHDVQQLVEKRRTIKKYTTRNTNERERSSSKAIQRTTLNTVTSVLAF